MQSLPHLALASFLLLSCMAAPPQMASETNYLTPRQFAQRPSAYVGQTVSVRGFLGGSLYPLAAVFASEEQSPRQVVHIDDRSLEQRSAEAQSDYLRELGCVGHYVELSGFVSLLPGGAYGVSKISSIRTFEGRSFQGFGSVCYPK